MTIQTLTHSERGRLGGLRNRGQTRSQGIPLFSVLRAIFSRNIDTPYFQVVEQVRIRCPWSRFNYETYLVYKGRFKRGLL